MSGGEFPERVRRLVYIRAWFGCERDGRTDGLQVHHRRPRAAGGTSAPGARSVTNALLLCASCHRWIESNRTQAEMHGWLVRQGVDPASVPVLIYERGRVVLATDGTYRNLTTGRTA